MHKLFVTYIKILFFLFSYQKIYDNVCFYLTSSSIWHTC